MAQAGFTPISLYFSATAAAVPTSGNLVAGELALNTLDGKLYYKNSAGTVALLASTSGASGDVVGPASATDNALARFDLTTGKLIQNSVGILSDTGALSGLTDITASGSVTLSGGTANGVTYLNGSKVLTTGSALTFDGTNFNAPQSVISGSIATLYGNIFSAGNSQTWLTNNASASDTYRTSDTAQRYRMLTGVGFTWETAASGTAGAGISWSEQMRLTSAGNLGIGTSSPGVKLDVNGALRIGLASNPTTIASNSQFYDQSGIGPTISGYNFEVRTGNPTPSARMIVDSVGNVGISGNVGIGTTSPAAKLHLATAANNGVLVSSTDGTTFKGIAFNTNNNQFTVGTQTNHPVAFFSNNTERARIDSSGNVGIGTSSPLTKFEVDVGRSTFSAASEPYSVGVRYNNTGGRFYVGAASASATPDMVFSAATGDERLRITNSGNVGIGTSSPAAHLQVYGAGTTSSDWTNGDATGAALLLQDSGLASGSGGQLLFASTFGVHAGIKGFVTNGTGPAGDLVFQTRGTSGNVLERMRIDASGNVLVGTAIRDLNSKFYINGGAGDGIGVRIDSINAARPIVLWNAANSGQRMMVFLTGSGAANAGYIDSSGTTTVFGTSSDYRLKNVTGALTGYKERLMSLQPKQGTWIADGTEFRGFLAHEFAVPYRASVSGEKDAVDADGKPIIQGMQASTSEVMADLVAMVNELITENASLKARLDAANL